eukprot:gene24792-10434_t
MYSITSGPRPTDRARPDQDSKLQSSHIRSVAYHPSSPSPVPSPSQLFVIFKISVLHVDSNTRRTWTAEFCVRSNSDPPKSQVHLKRLSNALARNPVDISWSKIIPRAGSVTSKGTSRRELRQLDEGMDRPPTPSPPLRPPFPPGVAFPPSPHVHSSLSPVYPSAYPPAYPPGSPPPPPPLGPPPPPPVDPSSPTLPLVPSSPPSLPPSNPSIPPRGPPSPSEPLVPPSSPPTPPDVAPPPPAIAPRFPRGPRSPREPVPTPRSPGLPGQPRTPVQKPSNYNIQVDAVDTGSTLDRNAAGAIVAAHNNFRAAHSTPPLTWDDGIASQAQEWANKSASMTTISLGSQ